MLRFIDGRISKSSDVQTCASPSIRRNGAAAEFSGLSGAGGVGVTGLQLNWGGGAGRDVMANDGFFVLRDSDGSAGPVTGQPLRVSGDPVAPTGPTGDGFAGALAGADPLDGERIDRTSIGASGP